MEKFEEDRIHHDFPNWLEKASIVPKDTKIQ